MLLLSFKNKTPCRRVQRTESRRLQGLCSRERRGEESQYTHFVLFENLKAMFHGRGVVVERYKPPFSPLFLLPTSIVCTKSIISNIAWNDLYKCASALSEIKILVEHVWMSKSESFWHHGLRRGERTGGYAPRLLTACGTVLCIKKPRKPNH